MLDEQYSYQGVQLTTATSSLEGILFIMDDVNNYDELLSSVGDNTEVVLLDSRGNGLAQMASYLADYKDLSFIEVASHGSKDSVSLGSLRLDPDNIDENQALLSQLGSALSDTGDLLLLGCDIAADENSDFLNQIAGITGADVAASSNGTGRGEDSDWVLETTIGEIDSDNNLQFYTSHDPNVYLASITGTTGSDDITGSSLTDIISAVDGSDTVSGLDGNDTIYGGGSSLDGDDVLYGGNGNDFLYGHSGNDLLYGESGNDALSGDRGDDTLWGGVGNDTLIPSSGNDLGYGGDGNDWIWGGPGNDTLYGESGTDTISGDAGDDVLYGGDGDDTLSGFGEADILYGGDGDDVLRGGSEADIMYGGSGNDTFITNSNEHVAGDSIMDLDIGDVIQIAGVSGLTTANVRFNGTALEVDTNATDFASAEYSFTLNEDKTGILGFTVADFAGSTLITFIEGNSAPTSSDTSVRIAYTSSSYTFASSDFPFNDDDVGDSLSSIQITSLPAKGSLTLNDVAVTVNQVVAVADITSGLLVYTPDSDSGEDYASFNFLVNDGTANSDQTNVLTFHVDTPPRPTVTVRTVDGVTVTDKETLTELGVSIVSTIPEINDTREEDESTDNRALADLSLATDSGGNSLLTLSLPVGIGGQVQSYQRNTGQTLLDLLNASAEDHSPGMTPLQQMQASISDYVLSVPDDQHDSVVVRTLVLDDAEDNDNPDLLSFELSGSNSGDEATVIDVRNLSSGSQLRLDNIEFALIVGSSTVTGGAGENYVVGDNSRQFIVLGAEDDTLKGGEGDDVIGSKGGDDLLYGDEGNDWIVGGEGSDSLFGGDGSDMLQGSQSHAGDWTFSLTDEGTLQVDFTPDEVELADSEGFSVVGNWQNDTFQLLTDGRFDLIYRDYSVLETYTRLAYTVTRDLTAKESLDFYVRDGVSSNDLAHEAFIAFRDQVGSEDDIDLLNALASQWYGDNAQNMVKAGMAHLDAGGTWESILLYVAQESFVTDAIRGEDGTIQLVQTQGMSESYWSWADDNATDVLYGGAGNDILVAANNDIADGGEGTDVLLLAGIVSDYKFILEESAASGAFVNKATGETFSFKDVEYIYLDEETYSLDINYKLLPRDGYLVEFTKYADNMLDDENSAEPILDAWLI